MTTLRDATPPPTERLRFLLQEARFGLRELRRHGGRIALLFVALWLPLWVFAALAEEVHEGEAFGFDQPLLQWVHALHGPLPDRVFMEPRALSPDTLRLLTGMGYNVGIDPDWTIWGEAAGILVGGKNLAQIEDGDGTGYYGAIDSRASAGAAIGY